MKTKQMRLENLVKLNQPKLFETLETMFSGNVLSVPGKYLLVSGSAPVLLVAHLDTKSLADISIFGSDKSAQSAGRCLLYGSVPFA